MSFEGSMSRPMMQFYDEREAFPLASGSSSSRSKFKGIETRTYLAAETSTSVNEVCCFILATLQSITWL